jgi:hypothetical protein
MTVRRALWSAPCGAGGARGTRAHPPPGSGAPPPHGDDAAARMDGRLLTWRRIGTSAGVGKRASAAAAGASLRAGRRSPSAPAAPHASCRAPRRRRSRERPRRVPRRLPARRRSKRSTMAASDAADSIKARADAAFRAGDAAEAVGLYGEALACGAASPPPHVLHANRSTAALRAGDAPLAVTDALACLRIDASYVKGYYRLGAALLKAGWTELALQAFLAGKERCGGSSEMNAGINEVRHPARGSAAARQRVGVRAAGGAQRAACAALRARFGVCGCRRPPR